MFAEYLKEREGLEILQTEYGFVTYKFRNPDCYIQDIYVIPEKRKSGIASLLADQIAAVAKSKGYGVLTGSVDTRANGAEDSHKVLIAYGMRPYTKEGPVVYYCKELV